MDIKTLYNIRTKKTIKAAILAVVFPDPGLIIESIIEAKRFDNIIKKEAIRLDDQPLVVVCSKDCKDNQGKS